MDFNHQQNLSIVQSTDENFSFHFNMLNGQDRQALKGHLKIVKKIDVPTQSFVDLEPSLLECTLKISNKQFKRVEILKGSVRDFTQTPYELEFNYGIGSKERSIFEERIKKINESPLKIKCQAYLGAGIKKTNTFTVTNQQMNEMGIVDKLFGDATEIYITRDQMSNLAKELSSNINIVEDYQMPETEFNKDFVESLINMTIVDQFKFVPF